MNLANWLARAGLAFAGHPAVAHGGAVHQTYAVLARRAASFAAGLAQIGLNPGDRVAIVAKNCPHYLESLYGCWWGGFAAVPANAKLHGAELAYILEHSGARLCLATDKEAEAIAAHRPATLERLVVIGTRDYEALFADATPAVREARADALAWLFYTSGTTGRPKGAMLSHRNLAAMSFGYLADVDQVPLGGPILHGAPMSHGSGIYILPHVLRAGVNVVPESGGFEPAEIFDLFARWRGAGMFAAPTIIKRLVEWTGPADETAIRVMVWGGAPMYVEDAKKALDRFGPRLAQIFGQGETPMTGTVLNREQIADRSNPRWEARLGSAGMVNSACEVRVGDENDDALPPGAIGEVLVRGDSVMLGYWRNPEATEIALRNGWLHTGDVGAFDEDGFLTLKDRSKDLIISGGTNIYPREVEEVLLTHPRVTEVSVIGRPDPEWGEIVVAYVVGEATASELDALCLSRIARFKRPKHYVTVEALPKNNYGKILKTELRAIDARREREDADAGTARG